MKVIKILLAITLSFILLSGYAFAESVLPTSGKIVGSIEGQNLSRDIQVKEFGDGYVIVSVPIFKKSKGILEGPCQCWVDRREFMGNSSNGLIFERYDSHRCLCDCSYSFAQKRQWLVLGQDLGME